MLNRRTLRIKAMQTIFAVRQSREANLELAKAYVRDSFLPDLNSMELQDKELLKQQSKEAIKIFNLNYSNTSFKSNEGSADVINDVVNDAISFYYRENNKDLKLYRTQMINEAEKVYDRYIQMLNLLIDLKVIADNDGKRDHSNFVKNLLIKAIESNPSRETISLRKNLDWAEYQSEIRQWFKEVRSDEKYQYYIDLKNASFKDDKAIVSHIVKDVIFKSDVMDKFMEDRDLNWSEDRAIIKSLVTKTVKSIEEVNLDDFELQELSYNWEDDKAFFVKLYEDTNQVEPKYEALIARKTKNWEIDRIAITDKIILDMAIAEMINFQSIPIKVTINEYIEVAKKYSTPKSKLFINGVLDVIAEELQSSGDVKKSGRGLIDNK
ncbi:MAG: transcription antitermination factor NusB [Bacteroidota bacterium]